jgi:hypothetical protein
MTRALTIRTFTHVGLLAICGVVTCATCFAQNPTPAPAPAPAPTASPSQRQDSSSTSPADPKKAKKVWTNEDVGGLNGPVSVVGNSKNPGKGGSGAGSKADGQYIANTKKELAKLQSQLDDTEKQLVALQEFSEGKAPSTPTGYPINKGYNRVPVDQQITNLQDKKKQLQAKIDTLLDEVRKKGVEPGQLR